MMFTEDKKTEAIKYLQSTEGRAMNYLLSSSSLLPQHPPPSPRPLERLLTNP